MVEFSELGWLFFYLFLALGVSFLCSMLEAVLLSVTHPYIEFLIQENRKAGPKLKYLKEHTDRSLAAILTLNTFAHTGGAAGVGMEMQQLYGETSVGVASFFMTLLILILSEIIPKSIGAAKWKQLAPVSAAIISILITVTFFVHPLERISKMLQKDGYESKMTREEMIAAVEVGKDQGVLEADETRVIKNLLRLDNIPAEDVMTPSTVMLHFHKDSTVEEVVKEHSPLRFSRIPVIDTGLDDIIGIALRNEILSHHSDGSTGILMKDIVHTFHVVTPEESVGKILDEFIKRKDHIFLVVDEHGATQGIVTLEDALETLLGVEIVDEDDSVEDMRKLAREKWDKRRALQKQQSPKE